MPQHPRTLIVMGVCGCGKSLIGSLLAKKLGGVFEDADDFHPPGNKDKMRAGTPLTDDDRWPWLRNLRARIGELRGQTPCHVLACSALKRVYRDILRGGDARTDLEFIFLNGSRETILTRMAARKGHYMPTSLLDSQFAILEAPGEEEATIVDVGGTPQQIMAQVLARLGDRIDSAHRAPTLPHEQASAAAPSEGHRCTSGLGEAAQALAGAGLGPGGGLAQVQADRLVEWAEENGCLIPDAQFSVLPLVRDDTGEHEVRFRESDHRAVKKTWPGTFGMIPEWHPDGWRHAAATPLEYLRRFEMQNLIFGDDVRLEGVMQDGAPSRLVGAVSGGCSVVISQPWLVAADEVEPHPTEDEVEAMMRERQFEPLPGCPFGWLREADGVLVMDAKPDNFIKTADGIIPFDLILARCREEP